AARVGNAVLTFFFLLESGPGLGDLGACRHIGAHALHGSISHRDTPAVFVFADIDGVRSHDSVFPGKLSCFFAKLGGLTVDADFIEEKSDTAGSPKPRHVFVVLLAFTKMRFVRNRLSAAADFAGQLPFATAGAAVSPRSHQ